MVDISYWRLQPLKSNALFLFDQLFVCFLFCFFVPCFICFLVCNYVMVDVSYWRLQPFQSVAFFLFDRLFVCFLFFYLFNVLFFFLFVTNGWYQLLALATSPIRCQQSQKKTGQDHFCDHCLDLDQDDQGMNRVEFFKFLTNFFQAKFLLYQVANLYYSYFQMKCLPLLLRNELCSTPSFKWNTSYSY